MESFLTNLWAWGTERLFQLARRRRWVICFALGFLLTSIGLPALSKTPTLSPTASDNTSISIPVSPGTTPYRQGEQSYRAEKFAEAVEHFQQAAQDFAAQGKGLNQARALSNLSLAQQALGEWDAAQDAITRSLKLSGLDIPDCQAMQAATIPPLTGSQLQVLAPSLDIYGRLWYLQGKASCALYSWQLAAVLHRQRPDAAQPAPAQPDAAFSDATLSASKQRAVGSQINQVQALQMLGRYPQAIALAEQIQLVLERQPDSPIKAKGLRSLGDMLLAVGELDRARATLKESLTVATQLNDFPDISAARFSLGNTWRAMGNLERERQAPIQYERLPWRCEPPVTLPLKAKEYYTRAKTNYQQATHVNRGKKGISTLKRSPTETPRISGMPKAIQNSATSIQLTAKLNLLSLLLDTNDLKAADSLARTIDLSVLPESRTKVYARINLAKSQACLQQLSGGEVALQKTLAPSWNNSVEPVEQVIKSVRYAGIGQGGQAIKKNKYLGVEQVEQAVAEAKHLDDLRAESYAMGNLGGWYEYVGWWLDEKEHQPAAAQQFRQVAERFTQEALLFAPSYRAADVAYQWQWQLGRLLNAQGDSEAAIANYEAAVKTLDAVRSNLLRINSDVQFNFRDNVEPVYRGLIDLLLRPGKTQNFNEARQFLDSLKLAELENFLRCTLRNTAVKTVDQFANQDSTTAAIYPILLKDRLEVIVKSRQGLHAYGTEIPYTTVKETVEKLRFKLEQSPFDNDGRALAEQVYDWLIRRAEEQGVLDPDTVETLVFVLDGPLRTVPMAALYDGERYLVQKYAIALSIGLELKESKQQRQLRALIAGQSLDPQYKDYGPLHHVNEEVISIEEILPRSTLLQDGDLTNAAFQNEIDSTAYNLIHLATHGQFSSDPNETFLLTGPGEQLRFADFAASIRGTRQDPIELLVLSACETATGDKRALLGLSGVTVQAGVRSTLGTLWNVDDRSTAELMKRFYQELLKPDVTKAEALRRAQLPLLEQEGYYPFHWSPYVVVGSWQSMPTP